MSTCDVLLCIVLIAIDHNLIHWIILAEEKALNVRVCVLDKAIDPNLMHLDHLGLVQDFDGADMFGASVLGENDPAEGSGADCLEKLQVVQASGASRLGHLPSFGKFLLGFVKNFAPNVNIVLILVIRGAFDGDVGNQLRR